MRRDPRSARDALVLAAWLSAAVAGIGCADSPVATQTVSLEAMQADAEAATPAMAALLSEVIGFASVEVEGPALLPETDQLVEHVLQKGREIGFTARRAAGGLVGVLEYGRGDETVGVLIHLDVVPPGDLAEWTHPPFSGAIADGRVFGRGAQDDKGALVGVLYGAKILIDEGMTFTRRLRIVLGTKEETSFEDVRTYFAEEAPPDFGIAPDGPFVVRGESGYADVGYAFPGLAPSDGARDRAIWWQGGTVVNSVPDSSFLVLRTSDPVATRAELGAIIAQVKVEFARGDKIPDLSVADYAEFVRERGLTGVPEGDLVLSSRGQIAHSSTPGAGRNAIVEIALVAARMGQLADNAIARAARFVDEKIGLSTDGSGFELGRDKPIPAAADTTASLDLVSTDAAADRVDLVINFRVGVANTTAEVLDKSGATAAAYGASATRAVGTTFDAYYYADDDPLLGVVIDSYRAVRGKPPVLLALGATTYAKAAPNLVSYGPVELAEDGLYFHAADEQFPIASLTRNAVLYAHVLQQLIQAPVSPVRER
ncbi:MAG TPA: Sapep family Mn(2+)-dependent dipeptidase [Candidatus Binatia bacterium]|nr:Sapep family Mn(2+)-dependent dipeptidase [Candidatus Binatia bacterium]